RSKIQFSMAGAGVHGGGCSATQTNQHGRATQYDQLGANRNLTFFYMGLPDVAHTTRQHDGLVVAPPFFTIGACNLFLKGPEITTQVRAAKFVVESSATQWPLNHDIQSGNNAIRLAVVLFPGLLIAGNPQVGNGKASQAGLGLSPPTSRPLVTNLSARAGSSTGERRNRGGMVMGFHLL